MVTFATKEIRDMVRANASKLALLPKDTAGIRLEIPDYLQGNFRTLQNAAFQIRKKHPGAKRNVLFDEDNLDLALDIKISDGDDWSRIFPADAKAAGARPGRGQAARRNLGSAEISSMMSE